MQQIGLNRQVFQRRSTAAVDFYRDWSEYKNGFGNPSQDHWLGNKYIYSITNQKTYQLRIDLRNSRSSSYYALYSSFSISDESDKYRLSIGSFSGTVG
ncbi:putative ryncolin-1-like [Apostichopus japonicus]|uniref:Putative ryncolin-1-like n=1 Tax=Stichopus japonicus TaxID=307972 RepID=A0A2G8K2V4_STIJA|nr:putative ryncolin-1-like [Apostichopus japonicus]